MTKRRKPDIQQLLRSHMMASARAMAAGVKHLQAKEASKTKKAKQELRNAEFWLGKAVRIERKTKAARKAH